MRRFSPIFFAHIFAHIFRRFTVAAVLAAVRTAVSSERLFTIVHINEAQKIFEQEDSFPHVADKGIFKQLM